MIRVSNQRVRAKLIQSDVGLRVWCVDSGEAVGSSPRNPVYVVSLKLSLSGRSTDNERRMALAGLFSFQSNVVSNVLIHVFNTAIGPSVEV